MSPGKWKPKSWPTPKKRSFVGAGFYQWLPGKHQAWAAFAMRQRWMTPGQYVATIVPDHTISFFEVKRRSDALRLHGMRFALDA